MQDIIVYFIGVIIVVLVGWKTYKTITRKPSANDKCGGCTGCDLKEKTNCNLPK